jgi:hypothetical protein
MKELRGYTSEKGIKRTNCNPTAQRTTILSLELGALELCRLDRLDICHFLAFFLIIWVPTFFI